MQLASGNQYTVDTGGPMCIFIRPGGQRCLQVGLGVGAYPFQTFHFRSAIIIGSPFCSRTTRRVKIHAESQRRFKDPVSDNVRTGFTRVDHQLIDNSFLKLDLKLDHWTRGTTTSIRSKRLHYVRGVVATPSFLVSTWHAPFAKILMLPTRELTWVPSQALCVSDFCRRFRWKGWSQFCDNVYSTQCVLCN